jgi:hypothetical protein
MPSRTNRGWPVARAVRWLCVCGAFLAAIVSWAQKPGELTVSIPAQPLGDALAAYASQTGLQLIYVSKLARDKSSPGAPAGLPPRAALTHLLQGTGLQFEFLNERSVRIFAAPPRTTAQHVTLVVRRSSVTCVIRGSGCW